MINPTGYYQEGLNIPEANKINIILYVNNHRPQIKHKRHQYLTLTEQKIPVDSQSGLQAPSTVILADIQEQ